MALKDLVIPSDVVKLPDGSTFAVRGLGLDSIFYLYHHHREPATELFRMAQSGELDVSSVDALVGAAFAHAPLLVAMVIACGAGEPEEWVKAYGLPLTIQVDAVDKIIRLTLSAEGGAEKLLETAITAMRGAVGLLPASR